MFFDVLLFAESTFSKTNLDMFHNFVTAIADEWAINNSLVN